MRVLLLLLTVLFLVAGFALAQGVRKPVWAGQFYDADGERLGRQIDGFLAAAAPAHPAGPIRALIVPHAGYVYSGRIAALGYKLVQSADFETVVILGPTHRVDFRGASIWPDGAFETPLGSAAVDAEAAAALAKATGFRFVPEAHAEEHSVEVQVPFIQRVLPKARIVPIVLGRPDEATMRTLASALAGLAKSRRILVVASTDMSHFLNKKKAAAEDAATIDLVRSRQTSALLRLVERGENILCGGAGVLTALYYAERLGSPTVDILARADSTEGGGPDDRVVGYFAAAISVPPAGADQAGKEGAAVSGRSAKEGEQAASLTDEQKKELLALARRTLESFLRDGSLPSLPTASPLYAEPRGAFVTLTKNGALRGCIGYIEAVMPLAQAVRQCAVYAATEDPRFPRVAAREVKDLKIEISVLTPARRIDDPKLVEVGKHGLIMSRDGRRGLLLPQVAAEYHWGREEFLGQTCLKAGLPADAWKKGAVIEVFEAIVFRE
ncbi:MAG: AmmeMemoRadiSam system protein B [Candidatus Aminicenantes bacterium]|nr:AmmeMemoRadiSam system protein B [Candidatus Aminicenantes bacterium]